MAITKIEYENFPKQLQEISGAPPFLYCEGTMPPPDYRYLCVIGSRRYSEYGVEVCKKLIGGLRNYPIIIVSGLAIGIDSIAHEQAIEAGLTTISFPGSGLSRDVLYPARHHNLAKRIVDSGGALLSSFEMDQMGTNWTFPARNRLMAGISHATLIVEGRKGSGTLLTAGYALEFGRDIMIVPGSIFSELSYGPHLLYRDGATPVTNSWDILKILNLIDQKDSPDIDRESITPNIPFESLSEDETTIMKTLQLGPKSSSDIVEKTSIGILRFNLAVSKLELKGLVIENAGIYSIFAF